MFSPQEFKKFISGDFVAVNIIKKHYRNTALNSLRPGNTLATPDPDLPHVTYIVFFLGVPSQVT
jgi:hypothetical protein